MFVLQHFECIQMIFYLFGLAPCHLSAENRKPKSCFRRVPVLISFLSSICVALLEFYSFYLGSYGLINTLINYALYGCILFSNVTANWQCWYYESIYENIIHRFRLLESVCIAKFSMKISCKTEKRRYTVNATLIIGCFSISAAIVVYQAWVIGNNPTTATVLALLTTFKELMCALSVLHFTLNVDTVRSFITELNKQFRWSATGSYHHRHYQHVATKVAFLEGVKLIHMDVFLLIKQINRFFGWHLLILMIHYFILITYSFYWIFLTITTTGKFYSFAESAFTLTYCFLSVTILVNSCEYCSQEAMNLRENVERFEFYASDNIRLRDIKCELCEQITNFRFDVTARGYFTLNRRLLSSITSSCSTYLIILIQFFLSSDRVAGKKM